VWEASVFETRQHAFPRGHGAAVDDGNAAGAGLGGGVVDLEGGCCCFCDCMELRALQHSSIVASDLQVLHVPGSLVQIDCLDFMPVLDGIEIAFGGTTERAWSAAISAHRHVLLS
jgi:hypothetical protein